MGTTLPSDAVKTNSDNVADDPAQSILVDLVSAVDTVNSLMDALGAAAQYNTTEGLGTTAQGAGTPDDLHVEIPVTGKTGAYTAVAADRASLIRYTGSGGVTLQFTAAATLGSDWFCYVRNSSSGLITLDPNGAETIDGATTKLLEPGQGLLVICNGSLFVTLGHLDINALTTLSTVDGTNDRLPIYDATDGRMKQVAPDNLGGGAWDILDTQTPTGDPTIDFTGIDSTYASFIMIISNLQVDTDDTQVYLRFGTGGSPTIEEGANYSWGADGRGHQDGDASDQNVNDTEIELISRSATRGLGNAAGECMNGTVTFGNLSDSSSFSHCGFDIGWDQALGRSISWKGRGSWRVATAVTTIHLVAEQGVFDGGRVTLYGIKHA